MAASIRCMSFPFFPESSDTKGYDRIWPKSRQGDAAPHKRGKVKREVEPCCVEHKPGVITRHYNFGHSLKDYE